MSVSLPIAGAPAQPGLALGDIEKTPLERYVAPAKPSLVGLPRADLAQALAGVGVPPQQAKMRVQQLWHWIYVRGAQSFDDMTSVSKQLRATRIGRSGRAALQLLACCPRMPTNVVGVLLGHRQAVTTAQLLARLRRAGRHHPPRPRHLRDRLVRPDRRPLGASTLRLVPGQRRSVGRSYSVKAT